MLQAAKELAERESTTVGRVISALARLGLTVPVKKTKSLRPTRGSVPVLPSRGKVVTLHHVQELMDREVG